MLPFPGDSPGSVPCWPQQTQAGRLPCPSESAALPAPPTMGTIASDPARVGAAHRAWPCLCPCPTSSCPSGAGVPGVSSEAGAWEWAELGPGPQEGASQDAPPPVLPSHTPSSDMPPSLRGCPGWAGVAQRERLQYLLDCGGESHLASSECRLGGSDTLGLTPTQTEAGPSAPLD